MPRDAIFSMWFLAVVGAFAGSPAAAEECGPLKIVASVDLAVAPDERAVFVPVSLQNEKKYMLLDTGGMVSELTPATVASLGLESRRTPTVRFYDVKGNYVDHATIVPNFAIGNLTGHNVDFVVGPDGLFANKKDIAGILGPGVLRFYDVAIDFGARTLTLLSQDHCDGKVIYWPTRAVAVVPMQVVKSSGHIVVPVMLDGQALKALVDTGAYNSVLNLAVAEGDFKLSEKQADMIPLRRLGDRDNSMVYRHTFKSLSFEGITIANPALDIIPDLAGGQMKQPPPSGTRIPDADVEQALPDMLIGMDILSRLHIYIAYKEQKLYITPASTPQLPPANTASAPEPAAASSLRH